MTTTTQIDDTEALSLLVTWFMNLKMCKNPLPEAIVLQGAAELKRQWAARGLVPENKVGAGLLYASMVWASMTEIDKLAWMERLIGACDGTE